jgi:hypothetical protein
MVQLVFDTAYQKSNYKIVSPSAIVALKLGRFSDSDIKDIVTLIENFDVDITPYLPYLSEESIKNYKSLETNIE